MHYPKPYFFLFILIATSSYYVHGQEEVRPAFPGGTPAFSRYILKNLKYPDVAAVIGLTGKVYINFTIEKNGSVTNVKAIKCLGAGCESEAIRVVSMSPKWSRGFVYGKPTQFSFTIPISFNFEKSKSPNPTKISELRKSKYGFLFYIKSKIYTVDEAQTILGKSFDPAIIETVENYDNIQYAMPDKKGIYLIVIKDH